MIIKIKVKPGAKEEKIEKINDNEYKISVEERAEDGKANNRVINLLAKELGVSFRDIKIKNPGSRDKMSGKTEEKVATGKDILKYFGALKDKDINWEERKSKMKDFRNSFNKRIKQTSERMSKERE